MNNEIREIFESKILRVIEKSQCGYNFEYDDNLKEVKVSIFSTNQQRLELEKIIESTIDRSVMTEDDVNYKILLMYMKHYDKLDDAENDLVDLGFIPKLNHSRTTFNTTFTIPFNQAINAFRETKIKGWLALDI